MSVNEFSYLVRAENVGSAPFKIEFEANEAARKALAARFEVLSVEKIVGNATLKREMDGLTIYVAGQFVADVVQACVVTLEPVPQHIEEEFEAWFLDETTVTSFARAKRKRQSGRELHSADADDEIEENPMPDEQDDPEPIEGGVIDVGEVVAQHVSLALEPFPHSKEAKLEGPMGDEADLTPESPFSVLKDLL